MSASGCDFERAFDVLLSLDFAEVRIRLYFIARSVLDWGSGWDEFLTYQVVDEFTQASDPNVYAAGDCANHPNSLIGRRLRLESVQNAIDQAKAAAAAICGKPKAYAEVPWFWSDQYDLKLQIAGLSAPGDEVVLRGDPATRKFAAFYLRNGVVSAVDAVNSAPEYMIGRMMIAQKKEVAAEKLADLSIPMKAMMG